MSELQNALVFAYRANINRYQKLLQTYLTENERQFITRRLAEEEKALMEITQKPPPLISSMRQQGPNVFIPNE